MCNQQDRNWYIDQVTQRVDRMGVYASSDIDAVVGPEHTIVCATCTKADGDQVLYVVRYEGTERIHWRSANNPVVEVADVLGRVRLVKQTYPEGSYECPFCGYPVIIKIGEPALCDHGWCTANPAMPVAAAQKIVDDLAKARAETEARNAEHERRMNWIESERMARQTRINEEIRVAREDGYCLACLYKGPGGKVKHVRHKRPENCPNYRWHR